MNNIQIDKNLRQKLFGYQNFYKCNCQKNQRSTTTKNFSNILKYIFQNYDFTDQQIQFIYYNNLSLLQWQSQYICSTQQINQPIFQYLNKTNNLSKLNWNSLAKNNKINIELIINYNPKIDHSFMKQILNCRELQYNTILDYIKQQFATNKITFFDKSIQIICYILLFQKFSRHIDTISDIISLLIQYIDLSSDIVYDKQSINAYIKTNIADKINYIVMINKKDNRFDQNRIDSIMYYWQYNMHLNKFIKGKYLYEQG